MNIENETTENVIKGKIPNAERNDFQILLFQKIGFEHGKVAPMEKYIPTAKAIAKIIDDENNSEIRSKIMKGYEFKKQATEAQKENEESKYIELKGKSDVLYIEAAEQIIEILNKQKIGVAV